MKLPVIVIFAALVFTCMSLEGEEWREIPGVYRGAWVASDVSVWLRIIVGPTAIEIRDEESVRHVCRAKAIRTYRTGPFGLWGNPGVSVECANADSPRHSLAGRRPPEGENWTILLVQAIDGQVLQVDERLESIDGAMGTAPVGLFVR